MKHRTKSLVAALAAAAVSSFGVVALAPAASADTPTCVTRNEFQSIHRGMAKTRVNAIFDTYGVFADGFAGGYTRRYRVCNWYPERHYVIVNYRKFSHQPAFVLNKYWNYL